jgi:hypothetical protein
VSRDAVVAAMRAGWLTLTFMMLLSRVLFQASGPERMRAFLDRWKEGGVRRVWGVIGLAFAAFLAVGALSESVGGLDLALLGALVLLLVADGLVNALPAGFRTFKDGVQEAWVRRHAGSVRAGDRDLFATVNLGLALASAAAAAVVILYAPIATGTVVVAVGLALLLTPGLILATLRT